MATVKKRMSLEEHKELAKYLNSLRVGLFNAVEMCSGKCKVQDARYLVKAINNIDVARSRFEEKLFIEHPQEAHIHIYYPGPSR